MQQQSATSAAILPFTRYQKFVIAVLAFLQFTVVFDFMVLSPLGDILMKSLQLSDSMFGVVVSSYAFSAFVSGILTAGFADAFDRKKLLLFFYTGFIVGTLFCGMANSYVALLTARIVTGLFGGVIGSVSMAIVTDLFAINQRGRVMGFVQMAFAVSQVLGIPFALYLSEKFNWHFVFYLIVVISVAVGVVIALKLKPVASHLALQQKQSNFSHFIRTLSFKSYRVGYVATAFLSLGGFMIMPFSSAFLVNNIGISQKELPLVFMLTGIASIVIMPLVGRISDRVDKFKLFAFGTAVAIAAVLVYTNLGITPLWLVIVINVVMFAGIMSRMVPSQTLNSAIPDAPDRGAYMSINTSLQYMAGGFGATIAGMIIVRPTPQSSLQHFDTLGLVMTLVMLVCLWLVYRVSQMVKNKPQQGS